MKTIIQALGTKSKLLPVYLTINIRSLVSDHVHTISDSFSCRHKNLFYIT